MLNTLALQSQNAITESKRVLGLIRKEYSNKNLLIALGLTIGMQALVEWVFNHLFFASCVGTGLTVWVWTEVNVRLRKAEEAKDGSDMLWSFLMMFMLMPMLGMPIALASTAPPWLHDWLFSTAAHIKSRLH